MSQSNNKYLPKKRRATCIPIGMTGEPLPENKEHVQGVSRTTRDIGTEQRICNSYLKSYQNFLVESQASASSIESVLNMSRLSRINHLLEMLKNEQRSPRTYLSSPRRSIEKNKL